MTPPPTSIDGTDITGATIDGQDVQEITIDGQVVFTAESNPVAYSNLVAWYPFDSSFYGGSNADDVTATFNSGESGDSTAFDGFNNSLTFESSEGVTDINAGSNSGAYEGAKSTGFEINALPLSNQWTAMAWGYFFKNLSNTDSQHLINIDEPGFNDDVIIGQGLERGTVTTTIGAEHQDDNNSIRTIADSGITADANEWYHIAATSDGSTLKVYVDGNEKDSTTKQGNDLNWPSTTHRIGGTDPGITDRSLDGYIDDVRFYNTALSGSQINQIFNNTKP